MMTTKQQELLDLKRRQEELEIEIKIEEENRKKNKDKMTNKELLKVADELLDSCYKKQHVILNRELVNDFNSQGEKHIRKFIKTQEHKQMGHRTSGVYPYKINKLRNILNVTKSTNVGDIIEACDIINNDKLTENVKKEIEKNLSDEYKLMQLLIHIVKKQEEKLNNS